MEECDDSAGEPLNTNGAVDDDSAGKPLNTNGAVDYDSAGEPLNTKESTNTNAQICRYKDMIMGTFAKNKRTMIDDIRTLAAAILSGLLGFLNPIAGDVYTMILIFIINFAVGYMAGRVDGEDFSLKKAWRCIEEATMFFVLVVCIYSVGHLKGTMSGALQCVSTVVYAVLYFYSTNVLRNLKAVLKTGTPAYRVISALYYVLSFEMLKCMPWLEQYMASGGGDSDGERPNTNEADHQQVEPANTNE